MNLKQRISQKTPSCKNIKVISIPVVYSCSNSLEGREEGSLGRSCGAVFPNSVNMIVLNHEDLVISETYFEPFKDHIKETLEAENLVAHFIDDILVYHNLDGEIHCGTNSVRSLSKVHNKKFDLFQE